MNESLSQIILYSKTYFKTSVFVSCAQVIDCWMNFCFLAGTHSYSNQCLRSHHLTIKKTFREHKCLPRLYNPVTLLYSRYAIKCIHVGYMCNESYIQIGAVVHEKMLTNDMPCHLKKAFKISEFKITGLVLNQTFVICKAHRQRNEQNWEKN